MPFVLPIDRHNRYFGYIGDFKLIHVTTDLSDMLILFILVAVIVLLIGAIIYLVRELVIDNRKKKDKI